MSLASGRRLGPYEIVAPLGAGGMGEVYEAKDTRLGRTVAIKVLPEGLAESPERRARFEREARTVSQLTHPHVCTLHDVGEEEGIHFLVLEHCEGETLARRLERGALSLEDTLRFGAQIAEALDAAHRRGVVHRDLKPANVMLTATGVKLLDFGLARLAAEEAGEVADLPTMTMGAGRELTEEGTVLGTFPYMSPEQVEGSEADARSDIFSLGAVLYEMATGQRAFQGKGAASVMAAVLRSDPEPLSKVQPVSPPALDHVVSRCLAKDPEERWQNAKDVAVELRWVAEAGSQAGVAAPVAKRRTSRERVAWSIAALALVTAATVSVWGFFSKTPEPGPGPREIRFALPAVPDSQFVQRVETLDLALSPDGTRLAVVLDHQGRREIWIRPLDAVRFRRLDGTMDASSPFWSPDGEFLAFFAGGALKRVPASGGVVQSLCDVQGANTGDWSPEGVIVFTQSMTAGSGIFTVPATGGVPEPLVPDDPDLSAGAVRFPHVLPDGKRVLFHKFYPPKGANVLAVADLGTGEGRALFPFASRVAYDPSTGRLLYVTDGTLVARPFDLETLTLSGDPFPVAEGLPSFVTGWAPFAVAPAGVLAYLRGFPSSRLVWRDRAGRQIAFASDPGPDEDFVLSPEERRAVMETEIPGTGESDLWLLDLERGTRQRLTSLPGSESAPVWSPDGSEILFTNHGSSVDETEGVHRLRIGGNRSSELLSLSETWNFPLDWSRAGRLLYAAFTGESGLDLWVAEMESEERAPRPLLATPFHEGQGRFSPDGRWVAYVSDQSGREEVYLMDAEGGVSIPVSVGGGEAPRWRGDGGELFYLTLDRRVMAVAVNPGASPDLGVPEALFTSTVVGRGGYSSWEVAGDGQQFLLLESAGDPIPIEVAVGWGASFRQDR